MMDLTLSQIASHRTMSMYFLYDEKHCNIYYAAPLAAMLAIRKIARVVGSCRHRPAIPLSSRVFDATISADLPGMIVTD